eukprot:NODE_103_length_19640_cov_0.520905.p2 type:complete len:531 gc:universal NODE_103_length_19640_cov_0.520905:16920-15328(-)
MLIVALLLVAVGLFGSNPKRRNIVSVAPQVNMRTQINEYCESKDWVGIIDTLNEYFKSHQSWDNLNIECPQAPIIQDNLNQFNSNMNEMMAKLLGYQYIDPNFMYEAVFPKNYWEYQSLLHLAMEARNIEQFKALLDLKVRLAGGALGIDLNLEHGFSPIVQFNNIPIYCKALEMYEETAEYYDALKTYPGILKSAILLPAESNRCFEKVIDLADSTFLNNQQISLNNYITNDRLIVLLNKVSNLKESISTEKMKELFKAMALILASKPITDNLLIALSEIIDSYNIQFYKDAEFFENAFVRLSLRRLKEIQKINPNLIRFKDFSTMLFGDMRVRKFEFIASANSDVILTNDDVERILFSNNLPLIYYVCVNYQKLLPKTNPFAPLSIPGQWLQQAMNKQPVNPYVKYIDGNTALHFCIIYQRLDCVRYFMRYPPIFTVKNNHGDNPMHLAAQSESEESLKILLEYINGKEMYEYYLLVFRNSLDHLKSIKPLLIWSGLRDRNIQGKLPIDLADQKQKTIILNFEEALKE